MSKRLPVWLLAALLSLTLVVGCGRGPEGSAPTAPKAAPDSGQPTFLPAPPPTPALVQGLFSETRLIRARDGGEVRQGRFKVTIPPGALAADTYITVRDRSTSYVRCELQPHGIQFSQPVTLEIDLRGLGWAPYTNWSVYWHQPGNTWEDQHGVFTNGRVSAQLWHFSEYAPGMDGGRAGW